MQKMVRLLFVLPIAILLLPSCAQKQAPTPVPTPIGGGEPGGYGGKLVPDRLPGSYGAGAKGLELRGEGMRNGRYNGREMVEGALPSVYFGFDSSSISPPERPKLKQAVEYLQANPSHHLLVEGHCDWYGVTEYNLALGDRRAESVSNYLDMLGIPPGRVDKLSKGSLEATSGLSKSEASQDRRADLIILK